MQFSSYGFIFIFFPIVILTYHLIGHFMGKAVFQRLFLIASSLFFVGYSDIKALAVMTLLAVFNYLISKHISKPALIFALVFDLSVLAFFKYFSSFFPLGISFYTFLQIEYLYYVYKGGKERFDLPGFLNYITFFPRVSAGPLTDPEKEGTSFFDGKCKNLDTQALARGLYIFSIGLFKKTVISDSLALFADNFYSLEKFGFMVAWAGIISYSLQLYFDFSGYSDMALGLAGMLGYKLPFNFDSPYLAKGMRDFWRRWHISLSSLLGRLVYIPLGGSRRGSGRTYLNLMLVFLVSGIWHGKGLTFLVWGIFHGVFVCLDRFFESPLKKLPDVIRIAGTYVIAALLWVPFRAESLDQSISVIKAAFNPFNMGKVTAVGALANDGIVPFGDKIWTVYLIFYLSVSFFLVLQKKNSNQLYLEFRPDRKRLIWTVALFTVSVIHLSRLTTFVYTNF